MYKFLKPDYLGLWQLCKGADWENMNQKGRDMRGRTGMGSGEGSGPAVR